MPRVSTCRQHLFTCELNTAEFRNVSDCVERLKVLGETGRLWGQNMLLEVRGPSLLLTDIETKVVMERRGGGSWEPVTLTRTSPHQVLGSS